MTLLAEWVAVVPTRDRILTSQGFQVLRVTNDRILRHLPDVLHQIAEAFRSIS